MDKDKTDELRSWMEANNITNGINIDEDTKRYYPYNNLASQVIGFTGSDNQGLDGIEAIYENELKGEKRKNRKMTDARGGDIEKKGKLCGTCGWNGLNIGNRCNYTRNCRKIFKRGMHR